MALGNKTNAGGTGATFVVPKPSDYKFHIKCDPEDNNAVRREFTNPKTNEQGVVWEQLYSVLTGKIISVELKDTDFGKQLYVGLLDNKKEYVLAMDTKSDSAKTVMEALPNINKDNFVEFSLYNYPSKTKVDAEGNPKMTKGMGINQTGIFEDSDGEEETRRVMSFFNTYENGGWVSKNGYPTVKGEAPTDNEERRKKFWIDYFFDIRLFLEDYTFKNEIIEYKGSQQSADEQFADLTDDEKVVDNKEDVPF